ncbi:MAG: hypothetical protein U0X76_02480 [Bacteroidia bacterium]
MIAAVVIGLVTALSAVLLKNGVSFIRNIVHEVAVNQRLHYALSLSCIRNSAHSNFSEVFLGGKMGRGVANIIYTITRKNS